MSDEFALWNANDPLERTREAVGFLEGRRLWGSFPLDHVGWFETKTAIERISEEFRLPSERFPSVVLAREVGIHLEITRLRVGAEKHIELFSATSDEPPSRALRSRAHLAFRVPDRARLEEIAKRFGVRVHPIDAQSALAYLRPHLEIVFAGKTG